MARWAEQSEAYAGILIDRLHEPRGCIRPIPGVK